MDIKVFLNNFREAFGEKVDLPIVFWFSDHSVNPVDKIGCRHLSVRFGVLLRRDTSRYGKQPGRQAHFYRIFRSFGTSLFRTGYFKFYDTVVAVP